MPLHYGAAAHSHHRNEHRYAFEIHELFLFCSISRVHGRLWRSPKGSQATNQNGFVPIISMPIVADIVRVGGKKGCVIRAN